MSENQSWTRCDDRLPGMGQIVWLYDDKTRRPWLGSRDDVDGEGWLWGNAYGSIWHNGTQWDADVEQDADYQPSHWMPLPELP